MALLIEKTGPRNIPSEEEHHDKSYADEKNELIDRDNDHVSGYVLIYFIRIVIDDNFSDLFP